MKAIAGVRRCITVDDTLSSSFVFGASVIELLEIQSSVHQNALDELCRKHNLLELMSIDVSGNISASLFSYNLFSLARISSPLFALLLYLFVLFL